jgi:hypothetical protein
MLGERLWLGGKVKNKLSIRNSTKTEKIKGDQSGLILVQLAIAYLGQLL